MTIKASSQITISKVIDIHACYRYYKLQGSTLAKPTKPTKNPPDGWSDTEPAYISGSTNTLYFVDCNVYSDKSFSFSEVSKSSSYEAAKDAWNKANKAQDTATNAQNKVDNLQIGGRNLILDSVNLSKWIYTGVDGYDAKVNEYNTTKYPSGKYTECTCVKAGAGPYISGGSYNNTNKIMKGDVVTLSGWVYCSVDKGPLNPTIEFASSVTWTVRPNLCTTWSYFECVIISGKDVIPSSPGIAICFYNTFAVNEVIAFSSFKLEKGNVATDWTPAPEDSIAKVDVEYYLSTSATSLAGGSWTTTAPTWVNGKYMWSRTVMIDGAGNKTYSPNQNGVCIAGAKGATGAQGPQGAQGPKGDKGNTGAQGPQGAAGKSIGSVVNYYLATNASSGVTTSTTGWTTNVQSVTATNKYLWNYEVIKYTDGSVASTTTPCIIGAYGDKGATGPKGDKGTTGATGATGATGKGIKSVTEHYAVSASNSTAPTSWSTTVPTMTSTNRYLWNYETIAYTDNSTSDTTKRVIGVYGDKGNTGPQGPQGVKGDKGDKGNTGATGAQGPKGDTGAAGKGVKATEIAYQASTSGTTIPTGTWSSSIPAVSAGSFLWTRTIITYTDNSKSTSYSIGKMGNTGATGAKGDKGATGATGAAGKGVKSTTITYQAGSSGTSAPTGTWSASIPATSASKPFLWTKTVITYTDNGTSTIYSVGSTPDGIQIGGRNLVLNSSNLSKWTFEPGISISKEDEWIKVLDSSHSNSRWGIYTDIAVEPNTTYTLSVYCKNGNKVPYVGGGPMSKSSMSFGQNWAVSNAENGIRFITTITTGSSDNVWRIYLCVNPNATGQYVYFKLPKLEKGNKATDWTPAPEDIDNRFDTAETRITQAETSIETTNNQVALKASTETVTEIGNRANQIDKTLSDALTTIKQNSDAIASLTARDFKVEFTTITNQLTQLNGDLTAYKKEVGNWMRFDAEGNLVLGATRVPGQDAYELKLTKNRISFMLNDDEVAYISNNELYITNSTVVQNLKIGRFVWEIRGNGNLGLVWR